MRFTSSSTPSCFRKGHESDESLDSKTTTRFSSGFFYGLVTWFVCWSAVMLMVFTAILVFGSSFLSANTTQDEQVSTGPPQRAVGVLRKDLKAFVKNSKSDDIDTQVGAVLDLCRLHYELVNDARYNDYFQLQGFRAVASKRLKTYIKEVEIKKKRFDRQAQKDAKKKSKADTESDSTEGQVVDSDGNPYPEPTEEDADRDQFVSEAMSRSMYSMSQFTGGPVHMFGYLPGNFAPPWHDEDLINLIETTINPDHWKVNGGDADLFWYDPAKALVITGSSEVHDRVSDMLHQLRFLSR